MNNDVFAEAAEKIIAEQETIIGPVALEQARKVKGLKLEDHHVKIEGNGPIVIDDLIGQYRNLFGQTSVEVSKDAVGGLLSQFPAQQVPSLLR